MVVPGGGIHNISIPQIHQLNNHSGCAYIARNAIDVLFRCIRNKFRNSLGQRSYFEISRDIVSMFLKECGVGNAPDGDLLKLGQLNREVILN